MPPAFAATTASVFSDRLLVESVNVCGLGGSACGGDVSRHDVEFRLRPPGDEYPCAFPCEYPCHGAADSAAPAVDDGVLIPKQYVDSPLVDRVSSCAYAGTAASRSAACLCSSALASSGRHLAAKDADMGSEQISSQGPPHASSYSSGRRMFGPPTCRPSGVARPFGSSHASWRPSAVRLR